MNEENKEYSFHYTAPTAEERKQIEEIRRQYLAESEQSGKLKRLQFLEEGHLIIIKADLVQVDL